MTDRNLLAIPVIAIREYSIEGKKQSFKTLLIQCNGVYHNYSLTRDDSNNYVYYLQPADTRGISKYKLALDNELKGIEKMLIEAINKGECEIVMKIPIQFREYINELSTLQKTF